MSNPGVLTLVDIGRRQAKFKRFRIEDNIGESVHIHLDEMRFDFTVSEFITFSKIIRKSIDELDLFKGYSIDDFDESFLHNCSRHLKNLVNIKIEKIKISELKCIDRFSIAKGLNLTRLVDVAHCSAYRYLNGKENSFENYPQYNYFNTTNVKRLRELKESLTKVYPKGNNFVSLFNGQNIVMDGQHRVAILATIYGMGAEIDVMRLNFNGKKHIYWPMISNLHKCFFWILKKLYHRYFRK